MPAWPGPMAHGKPPRAAGRWAASQASCARYWPPLAPWVQGPRGGWALGWALGYGMGRWVVWVVVVVGVGVGVVLRCSGGRGAQLGPWALGRWARRPVTPTPPDRHRHRDWLLCTSSAPAAGPAGGRGRLRPRVLPAHRPAPQLQVHAPCPGIIAAGMGRCAPSFISFGKASSDRHKPPSSSHFYNPAISNTSYTHNNRK